MRDYALSLTKDYVSDWNTTDAIRELWQNAIDHGSYDYCIETSDGSDVPTLSELREDSTVYDCTFSLEIRSLGAKLSKTSLLLGSSSKSSKDIGNFGEGYKLAMLVLIRTGHEVVVRHSDVTWLARFKYSTTYCTELLTITEDCKVVDSPHVTFTVSGLTAEELIEAMDICLGTWPASGVGRVIHTKYGRILEDMSGRLYVNGLFVCDTQNDFGYDVKPEYLKLDRDRQTVSSWDMGILSYNMWVDSGMYSRVAQMVYDGVTDIGHVEYLHPPEELSNECARLIKREYGDAYPIGDASEEKAFEAIGVETVVVGHVFAGLATSGGIDEIEPPSAQSPLDILLSWHTEHNSSLRSKASREFDVILDAASKWRN